MASPVTLQCPTFAKPDTDPFSRFNALKAFLEDNIADADSAAITITASINGPVSATCPTVEDDTAGAVANLLATVLFLAPQIPYDHPWQAKLVSLIAATKTLPPPVFLDMEAWLQRGYGLLWQDLSTFGRTVYEDWSDRGRMIDRSADDGQSDLFSREEWVNLNAFLARVSVQRVKDLTSYGAVLLESILGGKDHAASFINDNLPAAAVWVIYAGDFVYEKLVPNAEDRGFPNPVQGEDEAGRDAIWAAWKGRLGELITGGDLHCNTRDWAEGALQEMECIA